jgi:hypothetical protein
MTPKKTANKTDFEKAKELAKTLVQDSSKLKTMREEIEKIYFMEMDKKTPPGVDKNDMKFTASPSGRNQVQGATRLMTATEPIFKVAKSDTVTQEMSTKIEDACKAIWRASSSVRNAKVHVDLARSALLHSDIHLFTEWVPDLIAAAPEGWQKKRLENILKRTPALFRAITPLEGFPLFGAYGLDGYLWQSEIMGRKLINKYGDLAGVSDDKSYTFNYWVDPENSGYWIEGKDAIDFGLHNMEEMNVVVALADGSDLFHDEDKKRHPFLYALWKGGLWNRENLALTAFFTSLFMRGPGPLVGIEGADEGAIDVEYAGGVRYIRAGSAMRVLDDKAADEIFSKALEMLSNLVDDSTIYKQAFGQPLGGNAPFSSVALLSQAGRLPLTDPTEKIQGVIADACSILLRRIKKENPVSDLIKGSDIPEDFDLSVTLELDLPQDTFKNGQLANQLRGWLPDEWIWQNMLQITDPDKVHFDAWTEQAGAQMFMAMVKTFIEQQMAASRPPQIGGGGGATPPGAPPSEPPQGPPGATPEAPPADAVTTPGGSAAAMAGGEAIPQTEPGTPQMPGQGA